MPRPSLADAFVLCPSTHPVPAEGKERLEIAVDGSAVEVWTQRPEACSRDEVRWFVLKFSGAGGRAERQTIHPAELARDAPAEVWAMNPPGYGGSTGPATLKRLAPAARAVLAALHREADGRPILIMGNSLGAAIALHLAAALRVDGLLLKNPPPLRELIRKRHGWWNLWLPAMAVARGVPGELDSLRNAERAAVPALIVTSARDEIVPPRYQSMIIDAYAGEKKVLVIAGGKHASTVPDEQAPEYVSMVEWLLGRLWPSAPDASRAGSRVTE